MHFSLFFLQKIYRVGFLFVLLLVVFDFLAFFYLPDTLFSDLFVATREQTPLTWLSSLAMFFLALASLSIYYQGREKIWYFLSLVFFFFSIDDATYLHERISGFLHDEIGLFGFFPGYIWVLLYMPLLMFSLGTVIYFLWTKTLRTARFPILIALFLLGGAIFLDFLDGLIQKNPSLVLCLESSCQIIALHLMRLTEEVLEVLALGILGYALLRTCCLLGKDGLTEEKGRGTVGIVNS